MKFSLIVIAVFHDFSQHFQPIFFTSGSNFSFQTRQVSTFPFLLFNLPYDIKYFQNFPPFFPPLSTSKLCCKLKKFPLRNKICVRFCENSPVVFVLVLFWREKTTTNTKFSSLAGFLHATKLCVPKHRPRTKRNWWSFWSLYSGSWNEHFLLTDEDSIFASRLRREKILS